MSDVQELDTPAPKKKSSTLMWVLLIFGGLAGLCCCGIGGFALYGLSAAGLSIDPQVAETRKAEIVDVEMPAGSKPFLSMSIPGAFKMVLWQVNEDGAIVLAEGGSGTSQAELKAAVEKQMASQGKNKGITIETREKKTFNIRGQDSEFEFATGKSSDGKVMHQIVGSFPSKGGSAILFIILPEEGYDEEAVTTMIESIK